MTSAYQDIHPQVTRQIAHWTQAAARLSDLEELASPQAWQRLEHYLGTALRSRLAESVDQLRSAAKRLNDHLRAAHTERDFRNLQHLVDRFRKQYLRTETTLDFYVDAINTRTNENIAGLLRACDRMAEQSMEAVLGPLGKKTPPVLTYIDKGLGASILKAGLRLWDGHTQSPAAAIKIVRHNLYRPTALIHESGHQVAHMLNWNDELAGLLERCLQAGGSILAETWGSWASEIAADTFAFVHTGFAAVAGLHDVLSGDDQWVFRYLPGDPHPVSYIRVLLGTAMCRHCFGKGPWDQMENAWAGKHRLGRAEQEVRQLVQRSLPALPVIARLCLDEPMKAFGGKSLSSRLPPSRVQPDVLEQLAREAGPALFSSSHWVREEGLRLLALSGCRMVAMPEKTAELLEQQRKWMLFLGKAPVLV
jgi:hypothetical protein